MSDAERPSRDPAPPRKGPTLPVPDPGDAEPCAFGADAIRQGDQRRIFRAVADHAFFGYVIADSTGTIRYANRSFASLHGYGPDELLGRPISLLHTPGQLAVSHRMIEDSVKNGNSEPEEHWYLHRDGTVFPLLVSCASVETRDDTGPLTAMTCVDLTPTRQAQAAFQRLFDEMLDGFAHHQIICDDSGAPVDYRYLAANPAFERMTGLDAKEIVGRTVREALPGVEQSWIDTFGKVAITGEPARFVDFVSVLDKYFEVTAYCPAPGEFACIFEDITESRRAEEALRASEHALKLTQGLAHLGSWTWDFAEDEVVWSDELFRVFGLEPAAVAPTFAEQEALLTASAFKAVNEAVARTADTGVPFELELETQRDDGTTRWLWARGASVTDPEGKQTGLWGAAQDITERKRQEAAAAHLEAQLTRAKRLESVGRLAGSVAHDFNNMLTVILGLTEQNLAKTRPEDPLHVDLDEIRQAAERSADLTRQLLAFARNQPSSPVVIDVNETVAGVLSMLKRLIGEDVDLQWKPDQGLTSARIDPSQVGQVLANLCINARDAIADVGTITVATENVSLDDEYCSSHPDHVPGDYVRLTVSDNGAGMDSETMSHLFEPFFTTKEPGRGTGLGLSTIYGIVKQNGGFTIAQSELGVGTTFAVHLPQHGGSPTASPKDASVPEQGRQSATILLVEDEPSILTLTARLLEGQGYTVLAAGTPQEALRLAESYPEAIDLLLTDVVMPEMNGLALAEAVRASRTNLRCLFMSGYTSDIITDHAALGIDASFIAKPFRLKDLTHTIRELLDS